LEAKILHKAGKIFTDYFLCNRSALLGEKAEIFLEINDSQKFPEFFR